MRMLVAMVIAGASAAGAAVAQAQEADVASRDAMRKLAFLVGEWEGQAWAQRGPGSRTELRQTESVRFSNSGHALVIEGTGWQRDSTGAERLVFNAVAVVTHDAERGYRMRSALMEGRTGDFELTLEDGGFRWGFETPEGRVRYSMRLTADGEWHETGEFSRDGAAWRPFIGMRVRKVDR